MKHRLSTPKNLTNISDSTPNLKTITTSLVCAICCVWGQFVGQFCASYFVHHILRVTFMGHIL